MHEGRLPACVEACPYQATVFGERDELIAKAKETLARHPDRYLQKVFGEKEEKNKENNEKD